MSLDHPGDRFLCLDAAGHLWRDAGHRLASTCDRCGLFVIAPGTPIEPQPEPELDEDGAA